MQERVGNTNSSRVGREIKLSLIYPLGSGRVQQFDFAGHSLNYIILDCHQSLNLLLPHLDYGPFSVGCPVRRSPAAHAMYPSEVYSTSEIDDVSAD